MSNAKNCRGWKNRNHLAAFSKEYSLKVLINAKIAFSATKIEFHPGWQCRELGNPCNITIEPGQPSAVLENRAPTNQSKHVCRCDDPSPLTKIHTWKPELPFHLPAQTLLSAVSCSQRPTVNVQHR
jgi:hypothetical protein